MKAYAVVGANFGDEGKGMATAKLAFDNPGSLVVRSAGGGQASHSVEFLGKRHAFRHIGSGTWQGAATYLAKEFIANPIILAKEVSTIGGYLNISAHPACRLTTPFDMMLNQTIEASRGASKHGSCGLGINETVIRCQSDYGTTISNIDGRLKARLVEIREDYFIPRFAALGLEIPEYFYSDTVIDKFVSQCIELVYMTKFRDHSEITKYETVIFEGNQGLLLDENHRFFPHVTRSATGTKNVVSILKELGISELETFYCTRVYLTRHGAGPLPFEQGQIYPRIVDKTNVPNPFQDTIRYAPINLDLLKESISADLAHADHLTNTASISISCIDQLEDVCWYVEDGEKKEATKTELLGKIKSIYSFNKTMLHTSPDVTYSRIVE